MYSRILVAVDGSGESSAALEKAIEIGRCQDSEVHVIYAINPGVYGATIVDPAIGVSDPGSERIFNMLQEEGEKIINDAKALSAKLDFDINCHLRIGDARDVILNTCNDIGADLIVIGSTGKGMAKRLVLGSVSSSVVFHSSVSTLVVRSSKK